MAKRKKSHSRKRHSHLSGHRRSSHRRRRRMSAGGGMFKILSDPIIGSTVGALAGLALKKLASKMVKDNAMIGTLVPVAGGFLLRKKMPFLAGGMAAGALAGLIAAKVPFLNDNNNTDWVNPDLLRDDEPLLLSADGQPLLLSEQSYSLNDEPMIVDAIPTYIGDADED